MQKRVWTLLMLLVLVLPVLAACGSTTATTAPTAASGGATTVPATTVAEAPTTAAATVAPTTEAATVAPTAAVEATVAATAETGGTGKIRVGLVTDVGKVTDGTFNQYAYEGLKRAEKELGVEVDFVETVNSSDYDKNIDQFATQKYDLIIGVGFLMGDAIKAAAARYPDINFAIVDFAYDPALPNVQGLVFNEDEAVFLAGALAAQLSTSGKIGVVGGVEIPPVQKYVLGYEAGAKYINPDIEVAKVYVPSFTDPAQGAEAAKNQISEGADVIFGAGGQTGSGAIQAASEADVFVIGVDQDEYNTTFKGGPAPKLVSSALKRVDNAVFAVIKAASEGKFEAGLYVGTAENGGVDYAEFHDAEVSAEIKTKLDAIKADLASGKLKTGVTLP
jgi:basic membrane protein A